MDVATLLEQSVPDCTRLLEELLEGCTSFTLKVHKEADVDIGHISLIGALLGTLKARGIPFQWGVEGDKEPGWPWALFAITKDTSGLEVSK